MNVPAIISIIALLALSVGIIGFISYISSSLLKIKGKLVGLEGKTAGIKSLIQPIPKDYSEMQLEIRNMQAEIRRLENCHAIKRKLELVMTGRGEGLKHGEVCYFTHEKETCNTESIKGVTLEELAQYVLDGKAIVRNETVEKEYKPHCNKIKTKK